MKNNNTIYNIFLVDQQIPRYSENSITFAPALPSHPVADTDWPHEPVPLYLFHSKKVAPPMPRNAELSLYQYHHMHLNKFINFR